MNKNNKNLKEFFEPGFCNIKSGVGFTLVEAIIYISGFALIIFGLVALVSNIFFSSNIQTNLLSDIDQARKASFQIISELRNAGTGNNGAYALDTVADQQLVFYSNVDSDAALEKVRYFLQSGTLKKGVTKYSGGTYNPSSEQVVNVQRNISNGPTNPIFYYYNSAFIGSSTQTSLAQPVSVTLVKMVKVQLTIFNKAGVKNTNTYQINASGVIRNLKTNLGD